MRMIKKLSLILAMLMTISVPLSACSGFLPATNMQSANRGDSSSNSSANESSNHSKESASSAQTESSLNSSSISSSSSSIEESSEDSSSEYSEESSYEEIFSNSSEDSYEDSLEESSLEDSSLNSSEDVDASSFEENSSEDGESSSDEESSFQSSSDRSSEVIEDSSEDSSEESSSTYSEESSIPSSEEHSSSDTEDSSEEYSSSDTEDSSESSEIEVDPQHTIVDMAYQLGWGQSLSGSYTLTGTVIAVSTGSKLNVTIEIEGREDYPIYCYNLQGATTSIEIGDVITVCGSLKNYKGTIEFDAASLVSHEEYEPPIIENDPYANVTAAEFYANYTPAISNEDAYFRTLHGFMSGELETPDQAPTLATYQPKIGSVYVRNSTMLFDESGKEYTVVDCYGNEAFKVYRDGAYITLEEVAAFVYAFGTYPANYSTNKKESPSDSVWGEYLRLNHTSFSGSTSKYPYEPELPNISGCGGTLNYYEMDIGTTGTDCDPSYDITIYNDGRSITRGAARIVYGKNDLNKDGVYGPGEHYLFYTYNHYNDFQEYLNYAGGWGEMFGNITGGGTLSSKYDCNPTSYVEVMLGPITSYALVPLSQFYNHYYNSKFAFKLA